MLLCANTPQLKAHALFYIIGEFSLAN
jgi:hypothetical protein